MPNLDITTSVGKTAILEALEFAPTGGNEDLWGFTIDDFPATILNTVEGSNSSPITDEEAQLYFERHVAAVTGDAAQHYDMAKFVTYYETGHTLHGASGRFEIRDRSGINTKDRVGLSVGFGALAADSGRGLFGLWIQGFDHVDTDYPSLCGIELGLTILRNGLAYTDPWGGYGVTRTAFYAVNDGSLATHYKGHSAFNADGATKLWKWGYTFRKCDIGIYGLAYTDTDIDGIIKIRDSGDTKDVFNVTNIGKGYFGSHLLIGQSNADSGNIYFGSDSGADVNVIVFDGAHYIFYIDNTAVGHVDATGFHNGGP